MYIHNNELLLSIKAYIRYIPQFSVWLKKLWLVRLEFDHKYFENIDRRR